MRKFHCYDASDAFYEVSAVEAIILPISSAIAYRKWFRFALAWALGKLSAYPIQEANTVGVMHYTIKYNTSLHGYDR